jgi:hypothetical protein
MRRAWALAILCGGPLLAARPARAAPDEAAAAQALVEAGHQLMTENKLDEACPKFREAARIAPPGLGALKQLAECYEKAGRTASAWSAWREAEAGAKRAGQDDRATDAHQRAAALEPGLPRLAIEVSAAARTAPGLEIRRDGAAIGEAQWGVAVPVDPVRHLVLATAPGHEPWAVSAEVTGPGKVTLTVPALTPLTPTTPPGPVSPPADPGRGRRAAGLIAGGAGVATLGAAILLQALATSDLGACPDPSHCTGSAGPQYDAGRREQFGADALYALGAASLAAGALLYLTAPSAPDGRAARGGVRWTARVAPAALGLQGAW